MINESVAFWSTCQQSKALAAGEFSSRDLLELYIARIEKYNPLINALVTTNFTEARAQADAADEGLKSGQNLGRLHGIPITIKDAIATKGLRSTGGAVELTDHLPMEDAPVVSALKAQGAIIMGKTNLPTWSADLQSFNDLFGTTNNPWNLQKVPGGSSGGAAAAVACALTSFEIGTDIGGSIRIPSAFCGVYGHKPSWGLLPSTGYLDHPQGGNTEADINVLGPIARSVDDLRLVLDITTRQSAPWIADLAKPRVPVSEMRVAAWLDDSFCPVDANQVSVMQACVDKLRSAGISVDSQARPDINVEMAVNVGSSLVFAAMALSSSDEEGDGFSHKQWLQLDSARQQIRKQWRLFFQQYDAVLMPVCFVQAFDHQQQGDFFSRSLDCNNQSRPYLDLTQWSVLTGMAYLPSTVPPLGLSANGLPVGMQVVSDFGNDLTSLALADKVSELCGAYTAPPMALT